MGRDLVRGDCTRCFFIWDRFDSASQHTQTLAQLKVAQDQVAEAIRAADAAKTQAESSLESVRLLKLQTQEQQLRELWRVLPILDDIRAQTRLWLIIFDENRWNGLNEAFRIMPADSSTVLIQAARHSSELWTEVREAFQMLINADLQLASLIQQIVRNLLSTPPATIFGMPSLNSLTSPVCFQRLRKRNGRPIPPNRNDRRLKGSLVRS
jgi:hypothetical protein